MISFRFKTLKIGDGVGQWHANRFRVYLRPRWTLIGGDEDASGKLVELNPPRVDQPTAVKELRNLFDMVFNGQFGGGYPNMATVSRKKLRVDDERSTPCLDFSLEGPREWAPNPHHDYVALLFDDPELGFAVNTLGPVKEEQQQYDRGGPPVLLHAAQDIADLHFLAGRRSWVICDAADPRSGGHQPSAKKGELYFIETAAIERFSHPIYDVTLPKVGEGVAELFLPGWFRDLFEQERGTPPNIDDAIVSIWTVLLENYIHLKRRTFAPLPGSLPGDKFGLAITRPSRAGIGQEARTMTQPTKHSKFVQFQLEHYDSAAELMARPWVQEMIALHPYLGPQVE